MANAAAKQADQSMEEILQSIKRIIAEDESTAVPASTASVSPDPLDDVLELTQQVGDDGVVTAPGEDHLIQGEVAPMALEKLLDSLADAGPPAEEAMSAAPTEIRELSHSVNKEEGLVDVAAVASAAIAMQRLTQSVGDTLPAPTHQGANFRSGATVEDLVLEALRPMLKEWLDTNLPQTVERLVAKEVARISQRMG